ncbi:MAG: metallophosphoesterase [Cytophagaceae bacterium]|nr:metallophosphoesterase [Gemmatimonadaceae bacterium]
MRAFMVFAAVTLAACARPDAPTEVRSMLPSADASPAAGTVVVAVGDIVCGADTAGKLCVDEETAALTAQSNPTAVLALGDLQYEDGAYSDYMTYYDQSWGAFKSITYPVPGNHEYHTSGASGYFDYFNGVGVATGRAGTRGKGYYSTNIGGWHVVMLNNNCNGVGGCGVGSPQEQWLRADLAANPAACTLAAWHIPRFSSGDHGSNPNSTALWQALYEFGADVVLVGHDHNYERFAPQTAQGNRDDAYGIREFVVGTGGEELKPESVPVPHSEVHDYTSMGVLRLTLHADSYAWRFVSIPGHTLADTGSTQCHGPPTGGPPPTPPVANYAITCQSAVNPASCSLDAASSTDDGGFNNLTFSWANTVGRPVKTGPVIKYLISKSQPNVFPVTLTASDAGGLTNSITKTVSIPVPTTNLPPVPAFTVSCASISCTLDAAPSTDDGGFANLTFAWTNAVGRPPKTGQVAKFLRSVTYPNTFNVTLTATDGAGLTASVTQQVTIP